MAAMTLEQRIEAAVRMGEALGLILLYRPLDERIDIYRRLLNRAEMIADTLNDKDFVKFEFKRFSKGKLFEEGGM